MNHKEVGLSEIIIMKRSMLWLRPGFSALVLSFMLACFSPRAQGATAHEYGLIASLIAIATVAALEALNRSDPFQTPLPTWSELDASTSVFNQATMGGGSAGSVFLDSVPMGSFSGGASYEWTSGDPLKTMTGIAGGSFIDGFSFTGLTIDYKIEAADGSDSFTFEQFDFSIGSGPSAYAGSLDSSACIGFISQSCPSGGGTAPRITMNLSGSLSGALADGSNSRTIEVDLKPNAVSQAGALGMDFGISIPCGNGNSTTPRMCAAIIEGSEGNSHDISITLVPIPAAVWLFGSGLGLLGWIRRKVN